MKRILILASLLPLIAQAELGPELSYLANTPVSRLEFALTQWNTDVREWIEQQEAMKQPWARSASGSVNLDPENNRIQFYGTLPLTSDPERDCAQFIHAARDRFARKLYGNPLEAMFGKRPWDPPAPTDHLPQAIGKRVQIICFTLSYQTEAPLIPTNLTTD